MNVNVRTAALLSTAMLLCAGPARAEVVTVLWSAVLQFPDLTSDDILVQGTTTYDTDTQPLPNDPEPNHGNFPAISATVTTNGGPPSVAENLFISQYNLPPQNNGDILQHSAFFQNGQLVPGTSYRVFAVQIDYRDASGTAWSELGLPSTQAQLDALDDFKMVSLSVRNSSGHTISAFNFNADNLVLLTDALPVTCNGFFEPFADPIGLSRKERRVIPLHMTLADGDGVPLTPIDIVAPTVSVTRTAGTTTEELDVLVDSAGKATVGNSFIWNETTQQWEYNLSTVPFSAVGTYTVSVVAGDDSYVLDQPCIGTFVRR